MSEKQLTVAELMARAANEGRGGKKPRRRRSLEDGGVPVKELTGDLDKVDAKPAESRHSDSPIDEPEQQAPVQARPAQPEPPKAEQAPRPVQKPPAAKQPQAAATPQEAPVAKPTPAVETKSVPDGTAAAGIPMISVVHEDDPIRLTTDNFPAQAMALGPDQEVLPDEPEQVVDSKQRPRANATAVSAIADEAEETTVIPVLPEPSNSSEQTSVLPVVPDLDGPPEMDLFGDDETDLVPLLTEGEDYPEEDSKVSVGAVIFMTVIGVALGAATFLGFKALWANVNTTLVGALAGVMTIGFVGLVHALRTERDGMSMFLALLTGLALTFGPLLIVGM